MNRRMNVRPFQELRQMDSEGKRKHCLYKKGESPSWMNSPVCSARWQRKRRKFPSSRCPAAAAHLVVFFKSHPLIMASAIPALALLSAIEFFFFFPFKSADVEWLRGHSSVSRVPRRSGFSPKLLLVSLGLPSCSAHVHTNLLSVCLSACAGTQALSVFPWISPIHPVTPV